MIKPPFPHEFDEKESLIRLPVNVTYHSKLRAPAWAHPTRESASHAIRCFGSPDEEDHIVGRKILERLLPLQTTDSTDLHYGIWGWFAEEPPREMAPADWNWADFIGVRLLQILHDHAGHLPPDLAARTRAAAEHAAWSIFRRNVGPGYTNICAMGAVVCIVSGEMFSDPRLLEYGVRRLSNMRRELEFHGGFPEYNSPTYTLVVLEELERLLHLARHPRARADAEALLAFAWSLIAEQFHPGTGQWAGAQSRSYQDWIDLEKVRFLEARLGKPFPVQPLTSLVIEPIEKGFPHPCPESVRARFFQLPVSPSQYRHTWIKQADGTPRQISTTWFTPEATLGSMNRENTWNQRRVILGYWRASESSLARVRLRLLHNGNDFVSASTRNQQENSRILTGFHFAAGGGDYHPYFDRPPDGTFFTSDLRIRYEVEGHGALVRKLAPDLFELSVGTHKIVLRTGPLRFDGKVVPGWTVGREKQLVWVDGVFYAGAKRAFNPAQLAECTAAAALELLPADQAPSTHSIEESELGDERVFRWQAQGVFEVSVPRIAPKFD